MKLSSAFEFHIHLDTLKAYYIGKRKTGILVKVKVKRSFFQTSQQNAELGVECLMATSCELHLE